MAGPTELFDNGLRSLRRDRAARTGPVLFLHERALSDILERLSGITRRFSSLLLVGAPDSEWRTRLAEVAPSVTVVDPGAVFARHSGGLHAVEDELDLDPASFDLVVAIGTLDTVNDLPGALLRLRFVLKPDSLLIGAMSGGETLPRLRQAMRIADSVTGGASPHVHPRIEPASLAQLLESAGFVMPVVDIDRVKVGYRDLRELVCDLRSMAATNILRSRSQRSLTRGALAAAEREFAGAGAQERIIETFEILHFAAWSPAEPARDG
jgi:NADH dehydrogenase [ubiquinone] 1 alpha subcomplex assembly factor 5